MQQPLKDTILMLLRHGHEVTTPQLMALAVAYGHEHDMTALRRALMALLLEEKITRTKDKVHGCHRYAKSKSP